MSTPRAAEAGFLVLHSLRLKGVADDEAIAVATGLDAVHVGAAATELEQQGQARRRTGRISGWALTPAGRESHRSALAEERQMSGCRALVEDAYEGLLRLNEPFKALCTTWQLRRLEPPTPNDHTDPTYDANVIEGLVGIHASVPALVDVLGGALARFQPYGPRFDWAATRVQTGSPEWFTTPLIGSYHDVWMELHEDLLLTLGLERREEST